MLYTEIDLYTCPFSSISSEKKSKLNFSVMIEDRKFKFQNSI